MSSSRSSALNYAAKIRHFEEPLLRMAMVHVDAQLRPGAQVNRPLQAAFTNALARRVVAFRRLGEHSRMPPILRKDLRGGCYLFRPAVKFVTTVTEGLTCWA